MVADEARDRGIGRAMVVHSVEWALSRCRGATRGSCNAAGRPRCERRRHFAKSLATRARGYFSDSSAIIRMVACSNASK